MLMKYIEILMQLRKFNLIITNFIHVKGFGLSVESIHGIGTMELTRKFA